jgi:peptide deformylase
MAVRPLELFPASSLRQPAVAVDAFGAELEALVEDLQDTLTSVSAIGLTAPHIGVLRRAMVVRMAARDPIKVYLNPFVLWASDEVEDHQEGSVSMPGIRETIRRRARIRIAFQDLAGAQSEKDASGFEAAVLQHEIDQLDGIFWIDRLSRLKRDRLVSRFFKAQKRVQQGHGAG